MSEDLFNIARRDFLRACATGGAGLALLQYLVKRTLTCRSDGKFPGGVRGMEDALRGRHSELNPRYTFESFVFGDANRVTHGACLAVSVAPARMHNPLFIHGAAGSGKTHLLHAIGNRILVTICGERVFYVTGKQLNNKLSEATDIQSLLEFKKRFRQASVLLIDDIQLLAGKQHSQEEFFHLFNTVFDTRRQIIISSNCPPDELTEFAPRLFHRFRWGLEVELLPPYRPA